MALKTY